MLTYIRERPDWPLKSAIKGCRYLDRLPMLTYNSWPVGLAVKISHRRMPIIRYLPPPKPHRNSMRARGSFLTQYFEQNREIKLIRGVSCWWKFHFALEISLVPTCFLTFLPRHFLGNKTMKSHLKMRKGPFGVFHFQDCKEKHTNMFESQLL